jgi:hypothetical protein
MTEFTGLDIEMTFKDHYHEARVFFVGRRSRSLNVILN